MKNNDLSKLFSDSSQDMAQHLELWFQHHPPKTDVQRENHEIINAVCLDAAVKFGQICPDSPELHEALKHLKIAAMFGNLSLAIYHNALSVPDKNQDVVPPPANEDCTPFPEAVPFSEVIKQNPVKDITVTHFPASEENDELEYFEVHAVHQDDTKTSLATFADKERAEKHRDFRLEQYSVANKTGVSKGSHEGN